MFNVLLVDDDQIVLECLNKFVNWTSFGFKVVGTALSASEAVNLIKSEYVDVILTDIAMPGRSGLDLIRDAMTINPYIKTIVLSSYIEFKYAKEAMKLGAVDYLTKPIDFNELRDIFNKLKSILENEILENKKQTEYHKAMSVQFKAGKAVEYHYNKKDIDENQERPIGAAIESVIKYINEHYNEDITLQKLSEIAYLHPIYLCKLFKERTGENFMDYLMKVRIEQAKKLLGNLSLRIYDICGMVGYDSPQYFSKIFKETAGISPKDYRKKCHAI